MAGVMYRVNRLEKVYDIFYIEIENVDSSSDKGIIIIRDPYDTPIPIMRAILGELLVYLSNNETVGISISENRDSRYIEFMIGDFNYSYPFYIFWG